MAVPPKTPAAETEGVIKFQLEFELSDAPLPADPSELKTWRGVMHRLGLVGQQADRYDGFGFGNVSVRVPGGGFIISGTQTGAPEWLPDSGFCHVMSCDVARNVVAATGPVAPSSESLTHGSVYALNPGIGAVLHAHSPEIWSMTARLGLPSIPAHVAYGTPKMARAVARLHGQQAWSDRGLFCMLGHQDGVVSFAADTATAAIGLVEALAAAMTAKGAARF